MFRRDLVDHPRFWIFLAGALLGSLGFAAIAANLESSELDERVITIVTAWRSPALTQVMRDLTSLGSISVVLILAIVVGSIFYMIRDRGGLAQLAIIVAGGGFWPLVLKPLFDRQRPAQAERLVEVVSLSFPSGHSFGAASIYTALVIVCARHFQHLGQELFFYGVAGILIAAVGLSRIYLGAHFPTDVLAGLCGGLAWSLGVSAVFVRLRSGSPRRHEPR